MEKLQTAGDIRVYSLTSRHLHCFCISVYVLAGSMFEQKDQGITHMFEHMVFRNVYARYEKDFYTLLSEHGVSFNAATYNEFVCFILTGVPSGVPFALEILSIMLDELHISREAFMNEKGRIRAEIRENDDRNSIDSFASSFVWENTTLASPIAGSCSSVNRISMKRLNDYRREILTVDRVMLCVTGRVTDRQMNDLLHVVEKLPVSKSPSGLQPDAPVPASFAKREPVVHLKSSSYYVVRISFDIDNSIVSSAVRDLLYTVLFEGEDSLVYRAMSEDNPLVYDFDPTFEEFHNISSIGVTWEIAKKNVEESIRVFFNVLEKLKTGDFAFKPNLQKILHKWEAEQDDASELNWGITFGNHILKAEPIDFERPLLGRYEGITKDDVIKGAQQVFIRKRCVIAVKGNLPYLRSLDLDKLFLLLSD